MKLLNKHRSVTTRVVRNARKRGVKVYTRRQWGSTLSELYQWRRRNKPHSLLPGKPVDTVWQHITVTRKSGLFKEDCRLIERIGMERFGTGCSYNFMVDMQTGEVGVGQPLDAKGAHTLNDFGIAGYQFDQNAVSIAIACIGMPTSEISGNARWAISALIAACIEEGVVRPGFDYNPHRMVAAKDCPCDNTVNVMPSIRHAAIGMV